MGPRLRGDDVVGAASPRTQQTPAGLQEL